MTENEELRVDLNAADEEALRELPGIGVSLARRIIDSRPFRGMEDLSRVRGLGPASIERLKPYVEFEAVGVANETKRGVKKFEHEVVVDQPIASKDGKDLEVEAPILEGAEKEDLRQGERDKPSERAKRQIEVVKEAPDGFNRSQTVWIIAGAAFLSLLFSVIASLAVLGGINGTLDFNRLSAVRRIEGDLELLSDDLSSLSSSVDSINQRLEPLEGLSGRMNVVEGQVESLQSGVDEALSAVEAMQSDLRALSNETARLSGRVGIFDNYFEGLRSLLNEVFAEPTSEPTIE